MSNFYFDLFKEDFPYVKDKSKNVDVVINNDNIVIKNEETKTSLTIDCSSNDVVKIKGVLQIYMSNVVFIDFESTLFQTDLLPKSMQYMQYFNLSCAIEIINNKYYIFIGSEEDVHGKDLNSSTPIEKYFKNIDIYMTDINIRKSDICNKTKFNWLMKALYYIQVAGQGKYNYEISMRDFDINQQMIDLASLQTNYEKIFIVPVLELNNVGFASEEVEQKFKSIFDSKIIGK